MKCSSSLATSYAVLALVVLAAVSIPSGTEAYTVRFGSTITRGNVSPSSVRSAEKSSSTASTTITSSSATTTMMRMLTDETPDPSTFREAEVLGLRLMQEGSFQEALVAFQKGMKLPGSRPDVLRTKALSGPSPVGGAFGGTDSQRIMGLDDFELQAAHYNMACAHARLGNLDDSIANLAKAFENGFDNYSTVRGDPDLDPIKQQGDFIKLMDSYESKGFNPFGFFANK